MPPVPFGIEVVTLDDRYIVHLHGELDMASVAELEDGCRSVVDDGTRRIVIDLRGISFLDSTGLGTLLGMDRMARETGGALELIPGPPNVQRVFEVTGIVDELRWVGPDVAGDGPPPQLD